MRQQTDVRQGTPARAGHKLLELETRDWEQTAAIIGRFLNATAEDF